MRLPESKKIIGFIVTLYCLSFAVISGPTYYSIRSIGMGNVSVAIASDRTTVFSNPAGLSTFKNVVDLSVSPVIFSADGKFITLINELKDHKNKLSDISQIDDDFIEMLNKMDGQWVGVQYFPEILVATDNIGFGIYSTFPIHVRVESGHFIPKLALRGERNVVYTWAVGIPLKNTSNKCGISVEYLQRTPLKETITTYSETFIYFDKVASSKAFRVLGDLSEIKHGISFDVSFLHDFKKFQGFQLAYSLRDVLGVIGGKIVFPPNLTIGSSYSFPQMNKVKLIDNLIVAFEISDIFSLESESKKYEHFAKKLHAGLELDLHYAMLRMGINQGYFTYGLGIRYGLFFLDYAFSTEEMGYYPGQLPYKKHVLSMGIGIRFNKRMRKDKTGDKETDPSGLKDVRSDDKQPVKTKKPGEQPVEKSQDVINNITVEKPPVQSEKQEFDSEKEIQNRPEDESLIEEYDVERLKIEKSEDKTSEVERPEVEKPDVEKPEVERPEVKKPEDKKPEVEKPEVEKPEDKKPEADRPEPEADRPEVEKHEDESQDTEDQQGDVDEIIEEIIESITEEEKIGWE